MKRIAPRRSSSSTSRTGSRRRRCCRARSCWPARVPYLPPAVHLAVVDPGRRERPARGRDPRPATGRVFVGPDNGLLAARRRRVRDRGRPQPDEPALPPRAGLADLPRARHLRARSRRTWPPASRFDDLGDAGRPGEPRPARPAPAPRSRTASSSRRCVDVDRFGNLELNVAATEIAALGLAAGRPGRARLRAHPVLRRRGRDLRGRRRAAS